MPSKEHISTQAGRQTDRQLSGGIGKHNLFIKSKSFFF